MSGGIGLGHVTRDLAIARELRRRLPDVGLTWLAGGEARDVLASEGEPLAPECEGYSTLIGPLEAASGRFSLNLTSPAHLLKWRYLKELPGFFAGVRGNVALFKTLTDRERFDLVVGDETYELALAMARTPELKKAPLALILDFVGVVLATRGLGERAVAALLNRGWRSLLTREPPVCDRILFAGEESDVPESCLSFLHRGSRKKARERLAFLGHVLPFDQEALPSRDDLRARVGCGPEPLIVCSMGGTAFGTALLELCSEAFPLLREMRPSLRMILVCGPRLAPDTLSVRPGVEVRGFVEKLHELFAACDLAVVQGGGTTTLELTALHRPFLFFPLQEHFEQEVHVASRLARHGAGVRMDFGATTPQSLAEAVDAHLGEVATYPDLPAQGARRAATILTEMLEAKGQEGVRRKE